MTQSLTNLYDSNTKVKYPTTLIELTSTEEKRSRGNSIHVGGMLSKAGSNHGQIIIEYENVTYGSLLSISKKKVDIGDSNWYQYINLSKTTYRYMMITAKKEECLRNFPNTYTCGTSMTENVSKKQKKEKSLSGVVVLMIAALPCSNNKVITNKVWKNTMYDKVKSCKPNVLKSYDHHGSNGSCFSFGNKSFYGMKNNSSVGVYSTLQHKNDTKQLAINNNAKEIEKEISIAITNGVNVVGVILREIRMLLSPVLDTARQIQEKNGNIGLTDVDTSEVGCWNSFLHVNGRTDVLHTEKDCAYTFVTVPNQIRNLNTPLQNKPMFLFKVNSKQQVMLPMMNDISFA